MNIWEFKHCSVSRRSEINFLRIPTNIFKFDPDGVDTFNSILEYFENEYGNLNIITRTKKGGICTKRGILRMPAYDIISVNARIELTIVTYDFCARFQLSANANQIDVLDGKQLGGRQSYQRFKAICKKHGVDLDEFAVDNGKLYKERMGQPGWKPVCQAINRRYYDRTWCDVHHIDLNSSYMSGIAHFNPKLKPIIEEIYNNRKDPEKNLEYKAILTHSYGYFQSPYCIINGHGYALAKLSEQALYFNNWWICELQKRLEESGRKVLMINTDGIWYAGEIYHDFNEGSGLGQWKTDHRNCTFRMHSAGAYEFIEDGKYTPVVKGCTGLDRLKPRSDWEWGDIYKLGGSIQYKFDKKINRVIGEVRPI